MTCIWQRYPALLFGLQLFLGTLFVLQTPTVIYLSIALICTSSKRFFPTLIFMFLLPSALIYQMYYFPASYSEIEGRLHILEIRQDAYYQTNWTYRCLLKTKKGKVHCHVFSKERLSGDYDYYVKGIVQTKDQLFYKLKIENAVPINIRLSLTELRYAAKEKMRSYIQKRIQHPSSATFLNAIATGRLDDQIMKSGFNQLGLSHLMAISGFHFGLLAFALHFLFARFFHPKIEAGLLIVALTAYLLFIGNSSSIQRAWIFITIYLSGRLLERRSNSLNSLGVALIIALLLQPLTASTLSFQLSFLATAGILTLYSPIDKYLSIWIPDLQLSEAVQLPQFFAYGHILSKMFRKALSLTTSVHIAILPLIICRFHTFSLNSLVYNLFFPFLVSIGLMLFLAGVLCGSWIHQWTSLYFNWILKIVATPPLKFKTFYFQKVPDWSLTIYFSVLLCGYIVHSARQHKKNLHPDAE